MEPFTVLTGIAAPLMHSNIDTDLIIPGKELIKVSKSGFGEGLFSGWRYLGPDRKENPDFVLNQEPYRHAQILLSGYNFACGSSRENAVWALKDFGIRCVIASSYGHIFYANCFRNGMLPVTLPAEQVQTIAEQVQAAGGEAPVTVDLQACEVRAPDGQMFPFEVAEIHRLTLLEGLDAVSSTLRYGEAIEQFEAGDRKHRPWVYEVSEH